MNLQHQVSLKPHNTFGIAVSANDYCNITSIDQLETVLRDYKNKNVFVLGGGSNLLLTKDIEDLVLHINIKGIEVLAQQNHTALVKAQAGENWHEFVLWCIEHNYGGIENLSLIPGNVGASPIQNIGAYGVELKDVFHSCEAIHIEDQSIRTFNADDCQFDYRQSIFKGALKNKYIITSVTFKLTTSHHKLNLDYGAIKTQLQQMKVQEPTIKDISNAVIAIRQSKLPDPKDIGNSGSFFKNPVITTAQYQKLQDQFSDIPGYTVSETEVKVPAGWLIEKAGIKGKRFNDYGVHKNQALVLVNYGNASGSDIYNLALLIQKTVKRLFNIDIETEVNII
ncbi:MAG: UDP-N-acetylmuramate dehydrogenase [Winogradskyella sp.]|nr:UDP-N-acetylmuramate dehydrogenase [Winogradskyella sp.]